jgi:hypothetical protein
VLEPVRGAMTRLRNWLDYRLAHVPLRPPPFWRRRAVWVAWGLVVVSLDGLLAPAVELLPLCLVPIGLAAWDGALGWSLGLALALPCGRFLGWWWLGWNHWSLGAELVNTLTYLVINLAIALSRHCSGMPCGSRWSVTRAYPRIPDRNVGRGGCSK